MIPGLRFATLGGTSWHSIQAQPPPAVNLRTADISAHKLGLSYFMLASTSSLTKLDLVEICYA